eukprot:411643_1
MANTFVWKVTNFNVFRKAENGVVFKSDSFEMHGANWYLECYPNGNGKKNEGHVGISLSCSKLPHYTKEMEVYSKCSIIQTNWTSEGTDKYSQDHLNWGWGKTITNKQLQSLKSFTITCTIELKLEQLVEIQKQQIEALQTENNKMMMNTTSTFTWNIKNMNEFKQATVGTKFTSDLFEMHDATWFLDCYPNGNGETYSGYISIFLSCDKLPDYANHMEVHYKLQINDAVWNCEYTRKYLKGKSWGWNKTITNKQFQSLQSFKITCSVQLKVDQLMEIKKQQINALQTENTKLTQQISKSTEEIDEVNKNAYIHSNIITEQELDDMNSDNDEEKQFNDLKEYNELFDRHKAILKEWNVNTMKLDHTTQKKQRSRPGSASISVFDRIEIALQVAKGINHLQLKDINDDEKKQNNDININTALNGLQLWRKNVECNATINEQTNRFSTIASDG